MNAAKNLASTHSVGGILWAYGFFGFFHLAGEPRTASIFPVANALLLCWQMLQANQWQQLSPSGTVPDARQRLDAVWSSSVDGMYIFGGEVSHLLSQCALSCVAIPDLIVEDLWLRWRHRYERPALLWPAGQKELSLGGHFGVAVWRVFWTIPSRGGPSGWFPCMDLYSEGSSNTPFSLTTWRY